MRPTIFIRVRKEHPDDASAALYEGKAFDKLGDVQGHGGARRRQ